jgi:hypothetical protein
LEFKLILQSQIPTPTFEFKRELKVKRSGQNNLLLGIAFDYAFRFLIKRNKNSSSILVEPERLVAEVGIDEIRAILDNQESYSVKTRAGYIEFKSRHLLLRIESCAAVASESISKYLKDGIVEENYLKSLVFYAFLELFQRGRELINDFDKTDKSDLDELKELISNIDLNLFHAENLINLNPSFGKATKMIGGADADLIVDDTLIDIKVVKDFGRARDYLNQLIGYYLLSLIGGISGSKKKIKIMFLGVYFARHSMLWRVPISELGSNEVFNKLKDWLVDDLNLTSAQRRRRFIPQIVIDNHKTLKRLQEENPTARFKWDGRDIRIFFKPVRKLKLKKKVALKNSKRKSVKIKKTIRN